MHRSAANSDKIRRCVVSILNIRSLLKENNNFFFKIILDIRKNFLYTENMFYSNPLIANRVLKAAWHIFAVAGEVFY